eukprot:6176226-Pleurochrysis_carterae.AAC.1
MAADKGRSCVVHAGSRSGAVAVGVGIHACCGDAWSSNKILIVVGVVHILTSSSMPGRSVSSSGGWYSARSGNTVSRKTITCVVVMRALACGPFSTSRP